MFEAYLTSLFAGLTVFLAPCAVALLPGYLVHFLNENLRDSQKNIKSFVQVCMYAFSTLSAIALIFVGLAVLLLGVKLVLQPYMVYISVGLGIVIMIMGIASICGKSLSLHVNLKKSENKSGYVQSFVFGVIYALAAAGCVLPVFLLIVNNALSAPTLVMTLIHIAIFTVAFAGSMLAFYLFAWGAQTTLQKVLRKILPHMHIIVGVLLILAGIYTLWYNSVLL